MRIFSQIYTLKWWWCSCSPWCRKWKFWYWWCRPQRRCGPWPPRRQWWSRPGRRSARCPAVSAGGRCGGWGGAVPATMRRIAVMMMVLVCLCACVLVCLCGDQSDQKNQEITPLLPCMGDMDYIMKMIMMTICKNYTLEKMKMIMTMPTPCRGDKGRRSCKRRGQKGPGTGGTTCIGWWFKYIRSNQPSNLWDIWLDNYISDNWKLQSQHSWWSFKSERTAFTILAISRKIVNKFIV